jgi:hypothetical protein
MPTTLATIVTIRVSLYKGVKMKVSQLIKLLQDTDTGKEIYMYLDSSLYEIDAVDELEDRVDLNVERGESRGAQC